MVDPDNLLQFRKRLNEAGEFLCSRTNDSEAVKAYTAVLYVQSSLLLDAEEMKLEQAENPIASLRRRLDARLNDYLCEMKESYDDSIVGFNEAWDIMRKLFDEIERSSESTGGELARGTVSLPAR